MSAGNHSEDVLAIHARMLEQSSVRGSYYELPSGLRVHALETGDGPPVLHLHGSNTSALSHLVLLERTAGLHSIAVDRPGLGLSQPRATPPGTFRQAAVSFVTEVLDTVQWPSAALVGASMGGVWALWFALAHPARVQRLVLLGATPLLPGTTPPLPLRAISTPGLGDLLARALRPEPATIRKLMASMGEGDSISRYPDLIDSLVAAADDPIAASANLAELRAIITVRGFRAGMRITAEELRRLATPTLLVWGDHDPVGSVEVARTSAELIPDARLELTSGGHVPWLEQPELVARLLSSFLQGS
jgi:pimeloyl-ACP methyl ester carboxylesterase